LSPNAARPLTVTVMPQPFGNRRCGTSLASAPNRRKAGAAGEHIRRPAAPANAASGDLWGVARPVWLAPSGGNRSAVSRVSGSGATFCRVSHFRDTEQRQIPPAMPVTSGANTRPGVPCRIGAARGKKPPRIGLWRRRSAGSAGRPVIGAVPLDACQRRRRHTGKGPPP
jgi:hypothetical protein